MKKFSNMLTSVLLCCLMLCYGCAASPQAEAEMPETGTALEVSSLSAAMPVSAVGADEGDTPDDTAQGPMSQLTDESFQAHLDSLVSSLSGSEPVTLDAVAQIAPEFADMINEDPAEVSLLCLTDLLALENNEPLRKYLNERQPSVAPPEKMQTECELFRCLVETYEPSLCETLPDDGDAYQWLAEYYRFDILKQCQKYGVDPGHSFYLEHPVHRQFLIAMLREPVWRMPTLTPLDGVLYDQDSYVDAFNAFFDYLQFGKQTSKLTVEPVTESQDALCTETAVWTMRQAENFSVTLEIALEDGNTITLTHTP